MKICVSFLTFIVQFILFLFLCFWTYIVCSFFVSFFQFFSWAILILNNMFVVGVLYCVKLLSEETFLRLIITHQQWLANYIGCVIITQLKRMTQTFFKGVVHEQPWFSIVCLLWGFTIASSCCLRWTFSKSFTPFLFLFFANTFLVFTFLVPFFWNSQHVQIKRFFQRWTSANQGISVGFLQGCYGNSMVFPWCCYK